MKRSKAVVVIPFYKQSLSFFEQIALKQCFKVLGDYDIVAIKPHKLNLASVISVESFAEVFSFDNEYFESINGYNCLMLEAKFYEAFLKYNYILIHQLDAFVFADNLEYWCDQVFDYVGAPWLKSTDYSNIFTAYKAKIKNYLYVRYNARHRDGTIKAVKQIEGRVGNGGFSLRRVDLFAEYCIKFKAEIERFKLKNESYWVNEDIFWSIEINRRKQRLKIPSQKKALQFAFETFPSRAFRLNHNQLPFGCHAWDKNVDFWKPIFRQYGYEI